MLFLLAASSAATLADELVAVRLGLMCVSPDALAKLIFPGGSSRTAVANPAQADLTQKQSGGCIDVAIDARVSVVTMRNNTSIVTYAEAGGQPKTYVIPNINFRSVQATATEGGGDSGASGEIKQVIIAHDGAAIYYILTLPGQDSLGNPNMEIRAYFEKSASRVVLVKSQPSIDPEKNLIGFSGLFLAPDNKTLFFHSDAWATSAAIHSVDIATKTVSFVVPGGLACVVLAGNLKGNLIVEQHRYFAQGGSYDVLWLFDPAGKQLGLVSLDANSRKVCPLLPGPLSHP